MALTREQIRREINRLTGLKNSYDKERKKYKDSLNYADKLVRYLSNSVSYLNSSNDYMKRYFTISNKTADNGEISKTRDQINQLVKKLNNTVIPSIKSNINNLSNKITKIDREISSLRRQYEAAQA